MYNYDVNYYNVIGIDPGNNLGIGILHIDCDTNEIIGISSQTLVLDSFVNDTDYNVLLARVHKLYDIVTGLNINYQPVVLSLEAAFMNSRFPKSVIQLSQYVNTIELATRLSNPWCKIFKYPPKYIKSSVGAGGAADKNDMKANLLNIPEIASKIDLNTLTEHAIDSLSIAYVTYKELQLNPQYLTILPF